jgi:NAD(P)-dependent dehydrogenase (short-subunit alcohol dehydrogenase family)
MKAVIVCVGTSSGVSKLLLPLLSNRYELMLFSNTDSAACRYVDSRNIVQEVKRVVAVGARLVLIDFRIVKQDSLISLKNLDNLRLEVNSNIIERFILAQGMLRLMSLARWGRLVYFGSSNLERGAVGTVGYSISKYSELGLVKCINAEYNKSGIFAKIFPISYVRAGLFDKLSERAKSHLMDDSLETKTKELAADINNFLETV